MRSFSYPDKVRGVFNEGGLFGERQGWHLPGYDTSSWVDRNLSSGLPNSSAGVGFFVTTFDLNIPSYNDVFMSFTFDQSSQPYRAYLFVNGWMMGKRVANLGSALALEPLYSKLILVLVLNSSFPFTKVS
jgi:Beta-galactosidase jelly roll domain